LHLEQADQAVSPACRNSQECLGGARSIELCRLPAGALNVRASRTEETRSPAEIEDRRKPQLRIARCSVSPTWKLGASVHGQLDAAISPMRPRAPPAPRTTAYKCAMAMRHAYKDPPHPEILHLNFARRRAGHRHVTSSKFSALACRQVGISVEFHATCHGREPVGRGVGALIRKILIAGNTAASSGCAAR